jgi:hypothetical protein
LIAVAYAPDEREAVVRIAADLVDAAASVRDNYWSTRPARVDLIASPDDCLEIGCGVPGRGTTRLARTGRPIARLRESRQERISCALLGS